MPVDALSLLHQMLGPHARFRPGQIEAIEAVATHRGRVLVVQRTGWGKSLVYWIATRLLRQAGSGPAVVISPLLALMRNQILAAERIGVRAMSIHSANRAEWDQVESALAEDRCDVLLISPERLQNERFVTSVLPELGGRIGLFVVDEAHCISDWGHDFRPDYRRLVRILQHVPTGVPVLATTATANNRVVDDIVAQLGSGMTVLRGPLARPSLRLQNLRIAGQPERLAWLAENLGKFPGSGITYCLTVRDTECVAAWLRQKGFEVAAYHAGDDESVQRIELEQALLENRLKALVATTALGMGFDKPDLGFVIHYQRPGSVIAYYQQVGRAGRELERAYAILLNGEEDDRIDDYFIDSACPTSEEMSAVLRVLEPGDGQTLAQVLEQVNISRGMAEKALKLLDIDGAVGHEGTRYFRTPNPWDAEAYAERAARITGLRRAELDHMRAYVAHSGCLMEFLSRALDDPGAAPCGVCANCQRKGFTTRTSGGLVAEANELLRIEEIVITPRQRWPAGVFEKTTIPKDLQNAPGRALYRYAHDGWGKSVHVGKYVHGRFDDELVDAAGELIRDRWKPEPAPEWIVAIPSLRHPTLVYNLAERLAGRLGLPFVPVLACTIEVPEQKTMANSAMQMRNVQKGLSVTGEVLGGPVLLLDDIVDSGWTLTWAGWLLRSNGSGVVHPLALARATGRSA